MRSRSQASPKLLLVCGKLTSQGGAVGSTRSIAGFDSCGEFSHLNLGRARECQMQSLSAWFVWGRDSATAYHVHFHFVGQPRRTVNALAAAARTRAHERDQFAVIIGNPVPGVVLGRTLNDLDFHPG